MSRKEWRKFGLGLLIGALLYFIGESIYEAWAWRSGPFYFPPSEWTL